MAMVGTAAWAARPPPSQSGRYSYGRGGGGCGGIHRTEGGSFAVRLDHDRCRFDDRLGHLHRLGRYRAPRGLARRAARGMDRRRPDDDRRRASLWRTGGDDAACGRPVRLPARGLRRDAGVPVRLDPAAGDPDRHYRGGRRRLRALRRGAVAGAGRPDVVRMAGRGARRRARRRDRGDRDPHLRQPARSRHGPRGAEFFHQRQGAFTGADNPARMHRCAQP